MNYAEMSDFEINLRVADLVLDYEDLTTVPMLGGDVRWGDGVNWHLFNPCNSWADAGPIIEQNGMNLLKLRDGNYVCVSEFIDINSPRFSSMDKKPLRAAMIVFLMMQEAE